MLFTAALETKIYAIHTAVKDYELRYENEKVSKLACQRCNHHRRRSQLIVSRRQNATIKFIKWEL